MALIDRYGRPLTHLRISVTSGCNYRCIFCHREGELGTPDMLDPAKIGLVAEAASRIGIRYYKITGGEPLSRRDIDSIVASAKLYGRGEVSLTTNGYFLVDRLPALTDAGLDRINVSLHSLNGERYRTLTGVNGLDRVLEGLSLARDLGVPVKLNYVLTRLNRDDLWDVLEYASQMGFNVNVIELIPVGEGGKRFSDLYVSITSIVKDLLERAEKIEVRDLQSRPRIVLPSGIYVELIASYCNPYFCMGCTKIRLTHDGMLKPCINRNDNLVNLNPIFAADISREEKVEKIVEAFSQANALREPFFRIKNGVCVSYNKAIKGSPRFPLEIRQALLRHARSEERSPSQPL